MAILYTIIRIWLCKNAILKDCIETTKLISSYDDDELIYKNITYIIKRNILDLNKLPLMAYKDMYPNINVWEVTYDGTIQLVFGDEHSTKTLIFERVIDIDEDIIKEKFNDAYAQWIQEQNE